MSPQRITRSSLSEQICDILKESITNGTYKSGDKLPTEKELTEIYNVSRLTVRAALQRLNALGMVTSKAGDGTYVNEFNIEDYLKEVSSKVIQPKMLDDVADFRRLIDLECIRLSILNATDDDLERLKIACDNNDKKLIDILDYSDEKTMRDFAESDFIVHMTICELSKNSLYVLAYKAAQEIIKEYLYTIVTTRYKRSQALGTIDAFISALNVHTSLYEAIKNRNYEKAKKIFYNHVDYKVLHLPPEEL